MIKDNRKTANCPCCKIHSDSIICNHACTIHWYLLFTGSGNFKACSWCLLILKNYWYLLIYQWFPLIFPTYVYSNSSTLESESWQTGVVHLSPILVVSALPITRHRSLTMTLFQYLSLALCIQNAALVVLVPSTCTSRLRACMFKPKQKPIRVLTLI